MPSADNDPMEWWRQARFGMFIHWGLYALPAGTWNNERIPGIGEWIMCRARIPVPEYEALASRFNPVKFNARAWVKVAKEAGMKYLVITAKHHDGFAMYDSPCSDYDIVDATPWRRDPMAALARECRKAGIRLCFYYSQSQDWHDPDAMGNSWYYTDESAKDFERYLERKCRPQVRELLTQYGPIGLIWFDTPQRITPEQSRGLKRLVKEVQPQCLVSGRVGHGVGDYGSLGDNQHPAGTVEGDWETPCTLNDTWGFKSYDHNWKSVDYLIGLLVNCASKGVNYLLNVGPTAEGVIPKPSITRLRKVGAWLKVNGEAIYGTQASPFPYDFEWGRLTCKGSRLYLLFRRWPRGRFSLVGLRSRVQGVRLLADPQAAVPFEQSHDEAQDDHRLELKLPRRKPGQPVAVVALDLASEPDVVPLPLQQADGSVSLPAHLADIRGTADGKPAIGSTGAAQHWATLRPSLNWQFRLSEPGRYQVVVQTNIDRERRQRFGTHTVKVSIGRGSVSGEAGARDLDPDPKVNRWQVVHSPIGTVEVAKTGVLELTVRATRIDASAPAGLTLSGVRLVKTD